MKANRISIGLLSMLLLCVIFMSACSPTKYLSDADRANFLFARANQYIESDRYHYISDVAVDVRESGYEYSMKATCEEFYDGRDMSEEKYMYKETVNEFTDLPTEYVYWDGKMYVTSDIQKIWTPVENLDEIFHYMTYRSVYYSSAATVTEICPEPEGDTYTISRFHNQDKTFSQVYEYLWWAVPDSIYDRMKVESFREIYIFNRDGRLERYEAYVEVSSTVSGCDDWVSVRYKKNYIYDEFEITKPQDAAVYTCIENYAALDDLVIASNQLLWEKNGKIETVFDYGFSGAAEGVYTITTVTDYNVSSNGVLTYSMAQKITSNNTEESTVVEYDGTKVIQESEGSRFEKPVSQTEAYRQINEEKDFLHLDYAIIGDVLDVTPTQHGTTMRLAPSHEYLVYLIEYEMAYMGYYPDEGSVKIKSAELIVNIDRNGTLDSVSLVSESEFTVGGELIVFGYEHAMRVQEHE